MNGQKSVPRGCSNQKQRLQWQDAVVLKGHV